MKTLVLVQLAILVAASACGSARGATTDAGSTSAYSSRQQVHCNTVTMPEDTTVLQVVARCANLDDLPLAGSCSNPGPDLNAILATNGPLSWEADPADKAGWLCSWVAGGQSVHVRNATATICCAVKSQ